MQPALQEAIPRWPLILPTPNKISPNYMICPRWQSKDYCNKSKNEVQRGKASDPKTHSKSCLSPIRAAGAPVAV